MSTIVYEQTIHIIITKLHLFIALIIMMILPLITCVNNYKSEYSETLTMTTSTYRPKRKIIERPVNPNWWEGGKESGF